MKLTQFVNAMALIEGRRSRILFDPWVTYERRSRSDLYNFPELRLTPQEVSAIAPDFIYISHTHSDHFDPDTLRLFSKDTPIIISWYEKNFTQRMIAELGFSDIRVSDPEAGIPLNGGDHCWLNPGTLYPDTDSVAFYRIDDQMICNFNDNPFEPEYVRETMEKFGPVDIAMLPFAGHGPYSMFYDNLSDAEKEKAAEAKRTKYYGDLLKFVDCLIPRYLVPFAGGVLCGGEKALRYLYSGIGRKYDAVEYVKSRSHVPFEPILLSNLCSYDFENATCEGDYVDYTHKGEWPYLEKIAKTPGRFDPGGEFFIAPSKRTDLTRLLQASRLKQKGWQERGNTSSTAAYFFDVGEAELYGLSLTSTEIKKISQAEIDEPFYEIFRLLYSLLVGMLTGHYIWSNVKTQYINNFRKPNRFDPELNFHMNFLHL